DEASAREYVSSGFFLLSGLALLALGLFAALHGLIDWAGVLNVDGEALGGEAAQAVAVLAVCFAANLPLGVVQRVRMGYQDGFVSNLWLGLGNLLGLGALVAVIAARAGLPWLVAA